MKETIKLIKEYIASGVFPGASFATINKGQIHNYYLGLQQNFPYPKLTRKNLLYDLASVSKVLGVGTILIRDYLTGSIDIDRPLKDYYPAFHEGSLTVREFLTHTTGVNPFIKNRDQLDAAELKEAMNNIELTDDKSFKYTDVNFILLGFMLEEIYKKDLDELINQEVFEKFSMPTASFFPAAKNQVVLTDKDTPRGIVHDPKARLLKGHAGSAGIFASLVDLEEFIKNYLYNQEYFSNKIELLDKNFAAEKGRRSLAWDLLGDWLIHTGYTGTFILINLKEEKGIIFLSNRVHLKDERSQWIEDRNILINLMIKEFS
ncbi:serine hydrolase [Streptococcaceae bacterium ESL0687]|nr:serine hydrolase [Streptococcaceae bacterium ESL0687]